MSLPVVLLDFTANKQENHVKLDWSTLSEINNEYFTIERSSDGVNFEEIIKQAGAGNSNSRINYSNIDISPNVGYNYYKLSQTDFNGKKREFDVEVVYFDRNPQNIDLKIYPNPTNGRHLNLDFSNLNNGKYRIEIFTIEGKLLKRLEYIQTEEKRLYRANILEGLSLSNGIYQLSINTIDGREVLPFIVH